jgi:hypothetical protein
MFPPLPNWDLLHDALSSIGAKLTLPKDCVELQLLTLHLPWLLRRRDAPSDDHFAT